MVHGTKLNIVTLFSLYGSWLGSEWTQTESGTSETFPGDEALEELIAAYGPPAESNDYGD